MRRLLVTLLLPALAITPTAGCNGKECTAAGCSNGVNFSFDEVALDDSRPVNVVEATGCLGDICRSIRWRFERSGASRGFGGSDIDVSPSGEGIEAQLYLPHDAELNIRDTYEAWMELSVNGGEPVRIEDEVRLEQIQPNGPGCGPVCMRAKVG